MPIFAIGDKVPRIHPSAFIAPTADIVGDVEIHAGASIWYNAVIRGDTSHVVVGPGANIQDGAVIHGRAGQPAIIGKDASVAHNAIVHGATICERALIANGAQVLDGATIEEGALVAAGSVVLPDATIPAGMLAAGTPAVVKRPLAGTSTEEWVTGNPGRYAALRDAHESGIRELSRKEVASP